MTIKIVTDSTCDLPADMAAQHDITVLPAYVNIGEESYLDGIELTRQEFYENLPDYPVSPTTAAPAGGVFAEAYERLAAEGATEILSIHIAASLSGMLNAARLGADTVDAPVTLFDSRQLSMGLGLLAVTAAQAIADGATMDAVVELLEERVQRTYIFAALDTLEFLRRSGRVGWATFGVGTLLRIKPLLGVHDGEVVSLERVRTGSRARRHLIQHLEEVAPLEQLAFLHAGNPAGAKELRRDVHHLFPAGADVRAVEVTPTIGSHVGPGALGVACITTGTATPL